MRRAVTVSTAEEARAAFALANFKFTLLSKHNMLLRT